MKRRSTLLNKTFAVMLILTVLLNSLSFKSVDAVSQAKVLPDPGNFAEERPIEPDEVDLFSISTDEVRFEIEIPWQELKFAEASVDGKLYSQVSLDGWAKSTQAGAPELPILVKQVGVPFGIDLDISVQPGKAHTYELDHPVLPVVTQYIDWNLPLGEAKTPSATNKFAHEEDLRIYQGDAFYPAALAEISSVGIMRQQRITSIMISPVQYQPATNQLTVYESLLITVKYTGSFETVEQTLPEESPEIEQYLQANLVNYEEARKLRVPEVRLQNSIDSMQQISVLPWTPPAPGWRVKVRTTGFYKLSYTELQTAGLPVASLDPRTFQMFAGGQEIAIKVVGESDGNFGIGDYILFYGEGIDSKYTLDNVYWLTHGKTYGLRITPQSGIPGTAATPAFHTTISHWELDKTYYTNFPGSDDMDHFLWGFAYAGTTSTVDWTYGFTLPAIYPGSATLKITLFGDTAMAVNPDHHINVFINNVNLGSAVWDGKTWKLLEVNVPQGVLQTGTNTIRVTGVLDTGAAYDFVYIDWFDLTYSNSFTAQNNSLPFTYASSGTWKYQVNGFSTNQVSIFDVSDPNVVTEFTGASIFPSGSSYALQFEDTITEATDYLAVETSAYKTVQAIEADTPSDLKSSSNSADHITITHGAFAAAALTLKDHRTAQGLRAVVADMQDIYDEFNYGIVSPTAIRNFLLYAYSNWQAPAPTYVVLLGDGHYDPKDNLGYHRTSYIPPYLANVDPWIGETGADNRYVTLVGADLIPDMMLGRISVNSLVEANAFVNKIIAYETTPLSGDWFSNVLSVTDNADSAGNFPLLSEDLISCCLPSSYPAQKIYYGTPPYTDTAITQNAIISAINSGKLLVNYIGHGYTDGWASESLFYANQVPRLTNAGMLPVILAMTCSEGYHINPHTYDKNKEALGEVVTRADGKGAIASWSPTGQGVASGHDLLNRGFFNAVFDSGVSTIGQATLAGKLNLGGASPDLLDTYLLFGDPALILARSVRAYDDAYQTDKDQILTVSAPGVLTNDTTTSPNPLSAVLVTGPSNGSLTLNADGSFVYDPFDNFAGTDYFTYKASADGFLSNKARVTITVGAVNHAPTDIDLSPSSVAENQPVDTVVGTLSTTDEDINDTHTYQLVDGDGSNDNLYFTINPGDNWLTTTDSFNYEIRSEYSIRIRSTDILGSYIEEIFNITVTNVPEAPWNIILDNTSVIENQPIGTLVANLTARDEDVGDTHTFSLENTTLFPDNTSFSIIGNQLVTAAVFDFETKSTYTIYLRVTDQTGLYSQKEIFIEILPEPAIQTQIPLKVGWNLVSFKLQPTSTAITDVLASISGNYTLVYAWDAESQGWLVYDPTGTSTLTTLDEKMGFWINMTSADTLIVTGTPPVSTTIALSAGWNLVGYPSNVPGTLPGILTSNGASNAVMAADYTNGALEPWRYHGIGAPVYANDLSLMIAGRGYWVNVSSAGSWTVPYELEP